MTCYERQSFLGIDTQTRLGGICAGIIGAGGGGSHIGQQLAHIGIGGLVLCDFDKYEDKNHNRTVGGFYDDIANRTPKVQIAKRLISRINPRASIAVIDDHWQAALSQLRGCDVLFGCVDSYSERSQLEGLCRRYLIPYIDVGMDVHEVEHGFVLHGQVILSMPGGLCLRCFNFLRPELLEFEAQNYGRAGGRPQVIWPNGVLASTAVGLFMDLVAPWHQTTQYTSAMYDYDGNQHTITLSPRVAALAGVSCVHFSAVTDLGDPFWKPEHCAVAKLETGQSQGRNSWNTVMNERKC